MPRKKRSPAMDAQEQLNKAGCVTAVQRNAYSAITAQLSAFHMELDAIYSNFIRPKAGKKDDSRRDQLITLLAPEKASFPRGEITAHFSKEYSISSGTLGSIVYDARIRPPHQTGDKLFTHLPVNDDRRFRIAHLLGLHPRDLIDIDARSRMLDEMKAKLPEAMRELRWEKLAADYLLLDKSITKLIFRQTSAEQPQKDDQEAKAAKSISTCFRFLLLLDRPDMKRDKVKAFYHHFGYHPLEDCPADLVFEKCRGFLPKFIQAVHAYYASPSHAYQVFWAALFASLEYRDAHYRCDCYKIRPQFFFHPDDDDMETILYESSDRKHLKDQKKEAENHE